MDFVAIWNEYHLWIIGAVASAAFAFVNRSWLFSKLRRSKKFSSVPAQNIVDMTKEMLKQACEMQPAERNAINELIDKIQHISQQTIIETPTDEQ